MPLEQILASEIVKWKFFVCLNFHEFHETDIRITPNLVFNGNVDYCREISYFLRKNPYFEELQIENTSSNVPDSL